MNGGQIHPCQKKIMILNTYNSIRTTIIDSHWHAVNKTSSASHPSIKANQRLRSSENLTHTEWAAAINLMLGYPTRWFLFIFFYRSAGNLVCCCSHSQAESVGITQEKEATEQSGQANLQLPAAAALLSLLITQKRPRRTDGDNRPIVRSRSLAAREDLVN